MNYQNPEPVVTVKKSYQSIFLIILGVVSLLVVVYQGYILYKIKSTQTSVISKEKAEIAGIIKEAQNMAINFTAVPNAPELIDIPAPYDTSESDNKSYLQLKPTNVVSKDTVQNDVAFNMSFMGVTYGTYLNSIENPTEIYQIIDELHELTLRLNTKFNRLPFSDRFSEVLQMGALDPIVPGSDVRSVYPSIRAVDAYLAAQIMSQIDPKNENIYLQQAEQLVSRGIGYGLYSASDAEAAALLVSQYLKLYMNHAQ